MGLEMIFWALLRGCAPFCGEYVKLVRGFVSGPKIESSRAHSSGHKQRLSSSGPCLVGSLKGSEDMSPSRRCDALVFGDERGRRPKTRTPACSLLSGTPSWVVWILGWFHFPVHASWFQVTCKPWVLRLQEILGAYRSFFGAVGSGR